jgi:uncharacterized delta-60 repeat protein
LRAEDSEVTGYGQTSMKRALLLGVVSLVLADPFCSTVGVTAGCAGTLDASFDAGIIEDQWYIDALAVQTNGWVILGGSGFSVPGGERHGLARFRTDGSLDAGFAPVVGGGDVKAIVVQPDGALLLGGNFASVNGILRHGLARLNADGTLDDSFIPPELSPSSETVEIQSLALQPDGKVLAGGFAEGEDRQFFRLHPDGQLDGSFQVTNRFAFPLSFILLQPDGRLVVSGQVRLEDDVPIQVSAVSRLNPDGSLDASFAPPDSSNILVRAAALQPDGRMLLGVESEYPPSALHSRLDFGTVIRLHPDGSRDTTCAPGFMTETDARPAEWIGEMVSALAVQADGRILVGGGFDFVNRVRRACVARLHPDGSLDPSFETDITYHPGCDRVEAVSKLALAPEGKLVIGGYLNEINGLVRHGLARLNLTEGACAGVITLTTDLHQVQESAGQLTLTVARRGDLSQTATVAYRAWDVDPLCLGCARQGEDYDGRSGTLEFEPGESSKTLPIPILRDWTPEANEGFHLTLSGPTGGALLGYPASTLILILDHESAGQPGSVDPDFATPFWFGPAGLFDGVEQIQVQADGRILIAGGLTRARSSRCGGLARLLADGTPDSNFAPQITGEVWALLLQSDGQIVIGGDFTSVNGTPRTNLARLNADGSLDPGFAAHPDGFVNQITRQDDGRLVVGGFLNVAPEHHTNFVGRLQADGSPDPKFSNTVAVVRTLYGATDEGDLYALVVQPDGKVLLAGQFDTANGVPRPGLLRLNEDGSLDTSFNPEASGGRDVALLPDGRILIAGSVSLTDPPRSDVVRLHSDGSLDATFDASTQPPRDISVLARQADGRVVVGGWFGHYTTNTLNLARLNADGSLDHSFWAGSGASRNAVSALALLPDGDLLIGGGFDSVNGLPQRFIARLNGGVARPILLPPMRQANGELRVTTMGLETGIQFFLEASTNLADWRVIGTETTSSNEFHFIDAEAPGHGQRFYRARIEP